MKHEAKCPGCGTWSEIDSDPWLAPDGEGGATIVYGPWWWKDTAGCPQCGEIVLSVEGDCEMREVADV